MKIICSFKSLAFAKEIINNKVIDAFIISIDKYNLLSESTFVKEEATSIIHYLKENNKKVIIEIARLFHEDELSDVKELIEYFNKEDVDYFMYSDFGVNYILKSLNLINKAMLYSNTYLTNTSDTLIYQEKNGMVVLSNQINSLELIKINKNVLSNQIISAFGRALIMYTRRPLLTNYFEYRNESHNPKATSYFLQEEFRSDLYPIIENDNSSKIYDFGYYYLLDELEKLENPCDIIVSGELLTNEEYLKVLRIYSNLLLKKKTVEESLELLNSIGINLHKGAYSRKLTLLKGGNSNE